jgi:hypothetical protein
VLKKLRHKKREVDLAAFSFPGFSLQMLSGHIKNFDWPVPFMPNRKGRNCL